MSKNSQCRLTIDGEWHRGSTAVTEFVAAGCKDKNRISIVTVVGLAL